MVSFGVAVATHNRRDLAREAVASIVGQTRQPDRVVVVDDGSTDGTAADLRQHFPEVEVVEAARHGAAVARNTAVAHLDTEWVLFCDDDDLWHSSKLAEVEAYLLAHPNCAALNHQLWFFTTSEEGPGSRFGFSRHFVARDLAACEEAAERLGLDAEADYLDIRGTSYARLLERNAGSISASAVRRDVALAAGLFPSNLTEDWSFFLSVSRLVEWETLPRRLAFIRLHGNQTTSTSVLGAYILCGYVNAWWSGEPFLDRRASWPEVRRSLQCYAGPYRRLVRQLIWDDLRAGHVRRARFNFRLGGTLLPRWRDRAAALVPPRIANALGDTHSLFDAQGLPPDVRSHLISASPLRPPSPENSSGPGSSLTAS